MADQVPNLSHGFFQFLHRGDVPGGFNPILQVLECRQMAKAFKLRLSDGYFSFSNCCTAPVASPRFEEDGIVASNAVIQVLSYLSKEAQAGKINFIINDYMLLSLDMPIMGNPVPHSGRYEDYQNVLLDDNFYGSQVKNEMENSPRTPKVTNATLQPPTKRPCLESNTDEFRQPLQKRGNVAINNTKPKIQGLTQISLITPYVNRWKICGVASGKQEIRDVSSTKRVGNVYRVFSFNVTDETGNTIQITAFGEQAEKFNPIVENGQVYVISSDGHNSVRPANKKFNSTGHDYELILSRDAEIEHRTDINIEPKFKMQAIPLSKVSEYTGSCVDVLAIIERVGELTQVTKRSDQSQLNKRDIYLLDQSAVEVTFTLWAEVASNFDGEPGTAIGIKGAVVREFMGGISLSTTNSTTYHLNPSGDATKKLYSWYSIEKPTSDIKALSVTSSRDASSQDLRLIGILNQHGVDREGDKNYFSVVGLINSIKMDQTVYHACPTEGCKKKLIGDDREYRCEKCDRTFTHCKNLIMLQVEISDFTGSTWVTIFDEKASALLKCTGDDLAIFQKDDHKQYEEIFDAIRFRQFLFRVGINYEFYNDTEKLRWKVFDVREVKDYDKILANTLQKFESLH